MSSKVTYVFMDLGTTDDPKEEDEEVKLITELSMAAVRQDLLLKAGEWYADKTIVDSKFWTKKPRPQVPPVPRVQLKLTLCFNPGTDRELTTRGIKSRAFTKADLEPEKTFSECFDLINDFLNNLTDAVYFVAHNGFRFDFAILKKHLNGKSFSKDIMCVDTYYGFYDIETRKTTEASSSVENVTALLAEASLDSATAAADTKKRLDELRQANADRVERSKGFPWVSFRNKPDVSYTISGVYERMTKHKPEDKHKGDIDCQLMLRTAVKLSEQFVAWADENHSSFKEHVKPSNRFPKSKEFSKTSVEKP